MDDLKSPSVSAKNSSKKQSIKSKEVQIKQQVQVLLNDIQDAPNMNELEKIQRIKWQIQHQTYELDVDRLAERLLDGVVVVE